jgi:hypothetical protein
MCRPRPVLEPRPPYEDRRAPPPLTPKNQFGWIPLIYLSSDAPWHSAPHGTICFCPQRCSPPSKVAPPSPRRPKFPDENG